MERGVAELGRVVRRDVGRHADGDAGRPVGEEVREGAGQHDRLALGAVIGRAEVDRVLVDAVEEETRDLGQPRLGVAHGGGVIAVDVAEIALSVDQRIADGEILREADQRVIDRLVAMRMELAHHVADDLCRFLERRAGIEAEQPHAVEDAAVDRLQPVADVGQRPVHDGRQRVGEIALLERLAQIDRLDGPAGRNQVFSHGPEVSGAKGNGKSAPERPISVGNSRFPASFAARIYTLLEEGGLLGDRRIPARKWP